MASEQEVQPASQGGREKEVRGVIWILVEEEAGVKARKHGEHFLT